MTKASKKGRTKSKSKSKDLSTGAVSSGKSGKGGKKGSENAAMPSTGPGSKHPERRCTATAHRTGERCRAPAIKGGTVCRVHGGYAKHVREKAAERLSEMIMPALGELQRIMRKKNTTDADRIRAIREVLNRAGVSEQTTLKLASGKDDPWGRVLESALVEDRTLEGGSDDRNQIADDLTTDNFRAQDNEDISRRIDNTGHEVLRAGEGSGIDWGPDTSKTREQILRERLGDE